MNRWSYLLANMLLGWCLSTAASGDVITLTDGSRIIGTVEQLLEDKLILATQHAGTLEIDAASIVTIEVDNPVNVGMKSGDRLVGKIEWKPELDRAVVQTQMGGVPIQVDGVHAIWPKDGKSPEVLAMEAEVAQLREEMEAARPNWSASFEFGLLYTEGNTEVFNVRSRGELKRTSDKDMFRLFVAAIYDEEDGDRSAHEVRGGAYYEYLFTERFFGYGRIELEYDEFENLDLRLSTGGGVGYYWIKEDWHELKNRVGVGYLHETYMDNTTRDAVEGEVALDWRIDIKEWLRFQTFNTWYPTFDGLDDYRLISDNAFIIPLGKSEVWKLKLGALYEYKSKPNPGRERLDQTYYANLLLEVD